MKSDPAEALADEFYKEMRDLFESYAREKWEADEVTINVKRCDFVAFVRKHIKSPKQKRGRRHV